MVFSGRRDPSWPISYATAQQLIALLTDLPPIERWPAQRSVLGYRGSWLHGPDQQTWLAYDGVVIHEHGTETQRAIIGWHDDQRLFEQAILATAPPDLLPPGTGP